MKSPFKSLVAAIPARSTRFLRGAGTAAGLLVATSAMAQGPYYPVNPEGSTGPWVNGLPQYGSSYTAVQLYASPSLAYLQQTLNLNFGNQYTLQVPVPTGQQAPSASMYATAVALAVNGVLSGSAPTLGSGGLTDLQALADEAVGWNPNNFTSITTSIAQTIVQYNTATAVSNLQQVTDALAKTQPTIIPNIVSNIVQQAGGNTTVAAGIPAIVATAIADVANNATAISQIVNNGLAYGIGQSSLTAQNKANLFLGAGTFAGGGYVQTLLSSATAANNPSVIDAITSAVTFTNFLNMGNLGGGPTALTSILNAVVAGIPAGTLTNPLVMGAVADGALRSEGSVYGASGGAIATALANANAGTANYTNMVVNGYSNSASSAAFGTYVASNSAYSDALAAGAVVKGTLSPALILQLALTNGSATPKNVVASAVGANLSAAMTTLVGAINTTTHTPYGSASFGDIAYGGAEGAPLATAGNTTQVVLLNSASSVTALSTATVVQVVQNALNGANAGGNQAAFATLIFNTQYEAKYTNPNTVNNPGISAVQAAVDTLNSINNPLYPAYIAPVAAVAGDTYGYNQTNIANAGNNELVTDGQPGQVTAATAGENVVSAIRANSATTYTVTINALKNALINADPSNSAQAILYGSILINPGEYAAQLASAIKQSAVSDTALTKIAGNALLASNGLNLAANIQMVDQVVTHFKAEATSAAGINDTFGYVSHQIVINPSLTTQIATAATVIDPDSAHFIAHATAFSNPANVYLAVPAIFEYTQITNPNPIAAPTVGSQYGVYLSSKASVGPTAGAIVDQPAVAAAITAGLTTGILEAGLPAATTQADLVNTVRQAVASAVSQNGTNLQGPLHPFTGDSVNTFQQSDGTYTGAANYTSGAASFGKVSNYRTVGAAGAITGFVAQMVQKNDTTISPIVGAVLAAASAANVRSYGLAIAQAAAQALDWVGGSTVYTALTTLPMAAGNPAYDIANAMASTLAGFFTLNQLENAAAFGIQQANSGAIGAGALGLNANGINPGTGIFSVAASGNAAAAFYLVHSATGTPVTDIFNL